MLTVALIACVSKKLEVAAEAKNIYQSPLFLKAYEYAKNREVDEIYILSAKHHLLSEDDVIEPYDCTLNNMSADDKKAWQEETLKQLRDEFDLADTRFIILAGENYRKGLIGPGKIVNFEIPLRGLPIGKSLQWLDNANGKPPVEKKAPRKKKKPLTPEQIKELDRRAALPARKMPQWLADLQ